MGIAFNPRVRAAPEPEQADAEESDAGATPIISVRNLTKKFGRHLAVDDLSFDVQPGLVTGFLGPNGAGKTTTMRIILGLARPTTGTAVVLGRRYEDLDDPARAVGALLDPDTFHPKRTARNHLRWMAAAGGIDVRRADEVLETVGLSEAAHRRVGHFSTGMRQRLGLASALLGKPRILFLDEPANGLDPAGIRWLREFLRSYARSGRSVFVSSHILPEMAQVAEEVIVIHRGRLLAQTSVEALTSGAALAVRVRSPDASRLRGILIGAGAQVADGGGDVLSVRGLGPDRVGELAAASGVVLHELVGATQSLEDVFFELTREEETGA